MKKSRLTHRGARIGDMRHRIILHNRSIVPPIFDSVDFEQGFDGIESWAAVKTTNGKITLDGVGQEQDVTHELFIRYDYNVTSEMFIQMEDGRRLRILNVEDYEERHEYMRLLCKERGFDEAAKS